MPDTMNEANTTQQSISTTPGFDETIPFLMESDECRAVSLVLKSPALVKLSQDIYSGQDDQASNLASQIFRGICVAKANDGRSDSENALIALSKALGTETQLPYNAIEPSLQQNSCAHTPKQGYVLCYTVVNNYFKLVEVDEVLANLAKEYISGHIDLAKNLASDVLASVYFGHFVNDMNLMNIGESISSIELGIRLWNLSNDPIEGDDNLEKNVQTSSNDSFFEKAKISLSRFFDRAIQKVKDFFQFTFGNNEVEDDDEEICTLIKNTVDSAKNTSKPDDVTNQ